MKLGVYPGTFDPITNGHIDVLKRALKIFDKVLVLVAKHPEKKCFFNVEERLNMVKEAIKGIEHAEADKYSGLLVNYLRDKKATAIIRGMRVVSDFEYEFQMALMNRHLYPEIDIIYFFPSKEYTFLSSSLIKEVFMLGGDISKFVPPIVLEKLKEKYKQGGSPERH